jgi:glycine C-acetyltransferase
MSPEAQKQETEGELPQLMLSSYDYLGLAADDAVMTAAKTAIDRFGCSTGGVRLLTGTNTLHAELESALAQYKGTEDAVTFSSGYLGNLAAIATFFGPADRVVADQFVHRSIIDACKLARVRIQRFRHNDVEHLGSLLDRTTTRGRTLVVIEGVYSMDGDLAPLPEVHAATKRAGALLMVDEAHSIGVIGKTGRGLHEHFKMPPDEVDIWTGSLSKALGAGGGYVAATSAIGRRLRHASAPFIFSAALHPAACAAALESIRIVQASNERLTALWRNTRLFANGLAMLGFLNRTPQSPVLPVILNDEAQAFGAARFLLDRGIVVSPIVAPAVPPSASRLRLCCNAGHRSGDLEDAIHIFKDLRSHPLFTSLSGP